MAEGICEGAKIGPGAADGKTSRSGRTMPPVIRATVSRYGAARERHGVAHLHYKANGLNVRRTLRIPWELARRADIERAVDAAVIEIERGAETRNHVSQWIADAERWLSALPDPGPARAALAAWVREMDHASRPTLFQAIGEYRTARLQYKGPDGRAAFRQACFFFFGADATDRPLVLDQLRTVIAARLSEARHPTAPLISPATKRPYDPGTLKNRCIALGAFFRWCVAAGHLPANPFDAIDVPDVPVKPSPDVYSDYQARRMLVVLRRRAAEPYRHHQADAHRWLTDLLLFLRLSGLRISEALSLRWGDVVDDPARENHIAETDDGPVIVLVRSKNGKPRSIPAAAIDHLPDVIARIRSGKRAPGGFLFPGRSSANVARRMSAVCIEAGVPPPKRPNHAWRATAINLWRLQGMNERLRNYLAGHTRDVARQSYETAPEIGQVIAESRAGGFR